MIKYAHRLPPGKPVKVLSDGVIRKTVVQAMPQIMAFMQRLCNHFISYPDPLVVPVYSFKILEDRKNYYCTYSYDMMRLGILSPDERRLIDRIGDLTDFHGKNSFLFLNQDLSVLDIKKELNNYPKLSLFLKTVVEDNKYFDVHSGNILMDFEGQYRLVDLEGFYRSEYYKTNYDWITNESND
jgi:hypothetical protein